MSILDTILSSLRSLIGGGTDQSESSASAGSQSTGTVSVERESDVDTDRSAADASTDDESADEPRDDTDPDFSAVNPAFPAGEAGVALALACGQLESLALNRASIEALVEHAERSGADAFAFFERLDGADAAFDLGRRRSALLDML